MLDTKNRYAANRVNETNAMAREWGSINRKVERNSKGAAGVRRAHFKLLISIRNNYSAFRCCIRIRATASYTRNGQKGAHLKTTPSDSRARPTEKFYLCSKFQPHTEDSRINARTQRTAERTFGHACSGDADGTERRLIPYIRTKMIYFQLQH